MTASVSNKSLNATRERSGRWIIALALPLVAAAIQWQIWPYVRPFAWLLFYPAVFFATSIDGRRGAVLSAMVSIALVIYLFLPPHLSWQLNYYTYYEAHLTGPTSARPRRSQGRRP